MPPAYAELHCRSCFSFLTGASRPEELVAAAHERGYAALAVTDECSLSGAVHAMEQAQALGFRVLVGAEMQLASPAALPAPHEASGAGIGRSGRSAGSQIHLQALPASSLLGLLPQPAAADAADSAGLAGSTDASDSPNQPGPRLVLLAQTRRGYGNLSQWISVARRRAAKGQYLAHPSDLEGRVPHAPFLAGLPDCFAILLPAPGQPQAVVLAHAMWLKTWFGAQRCAIAVELLHRPHDAQRLHTLPQVAALVGLPLVACGDVLMHTRARKPLLDVLTATRLARPVADCGFDLAANAEAHLRPLDRLAALYAPDWLANSVAIAQSCTFSLNELRYEYPDEIVPAGHSATSWLRQLTEEGAVRRFPAGVPPGVRAAIEHELALIAQLRFEPYFLTVADIVQWARHERGILCQGRGSAANSAVCYCLGVTEVDPARGNLLFERFISAERNEPPDIDIDFEHQRREEVIQYIYRKYGRHRAALTGVMITYRPRSALRDVGRALGIDVDRIAAVSRGQHWFDGREVAPERLREQGFDPDAPICRQWMALTVQLIGFPRHLSQHPGGFVIARDDVSRLVPVENAAMDGRTVIQWDKDDLDALGLLKVDILALGMLSAIRRALLMVGDKLGRPPRPAAASDVKGLGFAMQDVPAEDPAVYDMLCRGDSVGTFQVESRAQMSMLPRLKPRQFYDLVIEVAIVRPGPIQGGMVHPYLRRRNGDEPVSYPSDEVKSALGRTLGVPIFQEQVMQLAILAADFTPGEADKLRRAMAAWKRKGGLGPFHERLVGRMVAKGYTADYAEAIFRQIQGFGEYGFPESHAASFALLVYVSAWLKCHHPDAFLAALLNSQPMGFYAPAQLVRDAREHGVAVLPVDVRHSQWETVLALPDPDAHGGRWVEAADAAAQSVDDPAPQTASTSASASASAAGLAASPSPTRHPPLRPVRLGFSRLLGFKQADAERLVAARAQGPWASVEDLARRAGLDAQALQLLADGDALAAITGHRHQAAWAVRGIDTRATPLLAATRTDEAAATLSPPVLGQQVVADYRSAGLSLRSHPLALLRPQLAAFKVQPAAVLALYRPGQPARASGLVTHRQRPGTAKGVVFVTLEDETGAVNVIVWPAVASAQRQALLASTLLTVYGVWQREGEVRHLIAKTLVDHTPLLQGLVTRSRDFH